MTVQAAYKYPPPVAYFKPRDCASFTIFGAGGRPFRFGGGAEPPTKVTDPLSIQKFRATERLMETNEAGEPVESQEQRARRESHPASFRVVNPHTGKSQEVDPADAPQLIAEMRGQQAVAVVAPNGQTVVDDRPRAAPPQPRVQDDGEGPADDGAGEDFFDPCAEEDPDDAPVVPPENPGAETLEATFEGLEKMNMRELRKFAAGKVAYRGVQKGDLIHALRAWWARTKAEQKGAVT